MATIIGTGPVRYVDADLVVDTAGAYADGDLLSDVVELAQLFGPHHQTCILQSLEVLDDAAQGAALDLLFLSADTSLGTFNTAFAPSDAVAGGVIGAVEIAAADYILLGSGSSLAVPQFNPKVLRAASTATRSLWLGAVSRDTPTYVAADDLHVRLGLLF